MSNSKTVIRSADDVYKCPWSTDLLYDIDKNRSMEHQRKTLQYAVKFIKTLDSKDDISIAGKSGDKSYECDAFFCDVNMIPGCNTEPAWLVLPSKFILKPDLMVKLGTGAISQIDVMALHRSDSDEKKSEYHIKTTYSFASCKILRVICSFYSTFVFCFAYAAVKITDKKMDLYGQKGKNKEEGKSVCVLDFQSGSVEQK